MTKTGSVSRTNMGVVVATLEAWIRGDIAAMMALRHETSVSYYNVDGIGGPAGTPVRLADVAARLTWLNQAYDLSRFTYKITAVTGDSVHVRAWYVCCHRTTGEEAEGPIGMIFKMHEGLIAEVHHFHDKGHRDAFLRITNSHAPQSASREVHASSANTAMRRFGIGVGSGDATNLDPRTVAEGHFDALCRGDVDEFAAWCDPAALFVDVQVPADAAPESAVGLGPSLERVRRFHAAYVVEEVRMLSRHAVGDTVRLMCRVSVRHRAKDIPFEGDMRCIYTIRNGRVWRLDSTRDVPGAQAWRRMVEGMDWR